MSPKKRKIPSISQPPVSGKKRTKDALSGTMGRLLERVQALDMSIIHKGDEKLPNLVSCWIYFAVILVDRGENNDYYICGPKYLPFHDCLCAHTYMNKTLMKTFSPWGLVT